MSAATFVKQRVFGQTTTGIQHGWRGGVLAAIAFAAFIGVVGPAEDSVIERLIAAIGEQETRCKAALPDYRPPPLMSAKCVGDIASLMGVRGRSRASVGVSFGRLSDPSPAMRLTARADESHNR